MDRLASVASPLWDAIEANTDMKPNIMLPQSGVRVNWQWHLPNTPSQTPAVLKLFDKLATATGTTGALPSDELTKIEAKLKRNLRTNDLPTIASVGMIGTVVPVTPPSPGIVWATQLGLREKAEPESAPQLLLKGYEAFLGQELPQPTRETVNGKTIESVVLPDGVVRSVRQSRRVSFGFDQASVLRCVEWEPFIPAQKSEPQPTLQAVWYPPEPVVKKGEKPTKPVVELPPIVTRLTRDQQRYELRTTFEFTSPQLNSVIARLIETWESRAVETVNGGGSNPFSLLR